MEALGSEFVPPAMHTLEDAMDYGLRLKRGRVFADLWGLREVCTSCQAARATRLAQMNLRQVVLERIACQRCGGSS